MLKGEKENLWIKHKKSSSAENKKFILERINYFLMKLAPYMVKEILVKELLILIIRFVWKLKKNKLKIQKLMN